MELNNITFYILRSSIVFTINIILILIVQNTFFKYHQRYTRVLYIAAIAHAVYPYGILNIPVGQDAVRLFKNFLDYGFVMVVGSVIAFIIITFILFAMEYRAYHREKEIFYVSHYDDVRNIYISCKDGPAFASGVFKSRIVIPDNDEDEKYILSHERQHILNRDNLIKLGYTVLMKLFWFQPIVYLSKHQLDDVIEMCCDEKVTDSYDKADVVEYMYCMVRQADRQMKFTKKRKSFLNSYYVKGKSQLYRRIKYLKNIRRKDNVVYRFAMVLLIFMMLSVGYGQGKPRQYSEEVDYTIEYDSSIVYCEESSDIENIIYTKVDIDLNKDEQKIYTKSNRVHFYVYK